MTQRPQSTENDKSFRDLIKKGSSSVPIPFLQHSPYNRPVTTAAVEKTDKSSLLWRDFITAIKRRKRLINHIRQVATSENDISATLKRLFLDLRQQTLKIIEDALELEYRSQFGEVKHAIRPGTLQLPPLASFRGLEGKEDILMLSDIINDIDDLYRLPNVQAFLPINFPLSRNPFLLGKNVDELAQMPNPPADRGNLVNELKSLELLRYKRASKTLLKAEAQVLNKMPLSLEDIELLWKNMENNKHQKNLIRVILTLLDDDNTLGNPRGPQLRYLVDNSLYTEPAEFLRKLTNFNDRSQYSVDIVAAVKHVLKSVSTKSFTDIASAYLCEWLRAVLGGALFKGEGISANGGIVSDISIGSLNNNISHTALSPSVEAFEETEERDHSPVTNNKKNKLNIQSENGDEQSVGQMTKDKNKFQAANTNATSGNPSSTNKRVSKSIASHQMTQSERKAKINAALHPGFVNDKTSKNASSDGVSADNFNALKYELIRMQQELLRRKVLDPKHFLHAMSSTGVYTGEDDSAQNRIMSFAGAAAKFNEVKGAANIPNMGIANIDLLKTNQVTDLAALNMLLIYQDSMSVFGFHLGCLSMYVDSAKENLYVQYRFRPPPMAEGEVRLLCGTQLPNGEEIIGFLPISKLYFDRMTGLQLDVIANAPEKLRRGQLAEFVQAVKSKLEKIATIEGVNHNSLRFDVELRLISNTLKSGSAAVNILIERSAENDGLTLLAIPSDDNISLKGKSSNTMSLFIHDKELLILLINQRGLYTLAMSKWSCMEMIASWVLSRTRVERVFISESNIPSTDLALQPKDVTVSAQSSVSYFQIIVDRNVDISEEVIATWRKQNIPKLADVDLTVNVSARQDLEMLYFDIQVNMVHLPYEILLLRKKDYEENKSEHAKVIVFTSMYDDLYRNKKHGYDSISADERERHVVPLSFGLTASELLIFGAGETIESNRTIAQNRLPTSFNPNAFMRNVLNRLHVTFDVSVIMMHIFSIFF
jgi:hypothetical protein